MFIINCKNYEEVSGKKIRRLVKTVEKVSKKYNVRIVLAPPQHLVGLVTEMDSSVMILAQHVDDSVVGSTTGFVVPELLKKSKVGGSIINHSEHRIPSNMIQRLVSRLKELKMISVLCVKNTAEVKRYAKFDADYIAIEPPELIGSGKAISKQRPELITRAASILKDTKSRSKLLCGAGIVSGADVAKAVELGSVGILVASGIVKAENWEKIISEFSRSMTV